MGKFSLNLHEIKIKGNKKVNCLCYILWAKKYQVPPKRYKPLCMIAPHLKFQKSSAPRNMFLRMKTEARKELDQQMMIMVSENEKVSKDNKLITYKLMKKVTYFFCQKYHSPICKLPREKESCVISNTEFCNYSEHFGMSAL